jgi:lysozyme
MDTTSPRRRTPLYLTLSALGLVSIAGYEGYRSAAYDDGVGVQTIGYGTTRIDGRPVVPSDRTTPERALIWLAADAEAKQQAMRRCLGDVPLHQHEWDAYVSLTYNIGTGAWCNSTLVRLLKQTPPDYAGACAQILRWTRAGGRVMRGLVTRRESEYRTCMGVSS